MARDKGLKAQRARRPLAATSLAAKPGIPRALCPFIPLSLAMLLTFAGSVQAQIADRVPRELENVGIEQKLDAQAPLDLEFFDENGRPTTLRKLMDGKPAILTLNYYGCPTLCGEQLNGLLRTLKDMSWRPGTKFHILTVSFDPLETATLASAKKDAYLGELGDPSAAAGWHFLTGRKPSIEALTQAVGFTYKWNADQMQWAHSAATIILTPGGRISRYLGGLYNDASTMRLSLVEASEGRIGTLYDSLFLWCFHYDPDRNSYAPVAMNIMRLGGGVTVAAIALGLLSLWLFEMRRRRMAAALAG
ncbi:hypothetical protein RAS1_16640 [Phycisphaerae bacterium RAS1]|nr:hypothetical protein RAS1_16640 [Phycisphaerae bacterium RAS1]